MILFTLLICAFVVSAQPFKTFRTQIITSGGTDLCDCSNCPGNFNCTNNYIWIDSSLDTTQPGLLNFSSPLPLGFLLKNISISLWGAFHCKLDSSYSAVSIDIEDVVIATQYTIETDSVFDIYCSCKNCHYQIPIQTQQEPDARLWWLGFNYQKTTPNHLRLILLENAITLSRIELEFIAMDISPIVTEILPRFIPQGTSQNSHLINVSGIFKQDLFRYICEFTQDNAQKITVFALPDLVSNTSMNCLLPTKNNNNVQPIQLRFFPDVSEYGNVSFSKDAIGPFQLVFYEMPVIIDVHPNSAPPSGGLQIKVRGTKFFRSYHLRCKFGDVIVPARFEDFTLITCISPPHIQQAVGFSMTQNGVDWSSEWNFTFTDNYIPLVPLIPSHSHPGINIWAMIAIIIVMLLVFVAGVAYLLYTRYNFSEFSGLIDESAIIDPSELDIKNRCGRGTFGDVYRAYWRHTEVAVKIIPPQSANKKLIEELMQEAKLMLRLRHPNITQVMGVVTIPPDVSIVTEYISRGSLHSILHNPEIVRLEPGHIRKFSIGACKGMAYLHACKILHRDLKCHNLLVDRNWIVKVADFGLSKSVGDIQATLTACGTPCWTAPEVLRNQRYSYAADVYSFAICLWEMLTRENPYPDHHTFNVVLGVATKGLRPTIPDGAHLGLVNIMVQCWSEDPDARPSFGDLVKRLSSLKLQRNVPHPVFESPRKVGRQLKEVTSTIASNESDIEQEDPFITKIKKYRDNYSASERESRESHDHHEGSDEGRAVFLLPPDNLMNNIGINSDTAKPTNNNNGNPFVTKDVRNKRTSI